MKTLPKSLAVLAVACVVPSAADAHRTWLLPSATVLSGTDIWVTIDAAVSNDLFYFEHRPMMFANLDVAAPTDRPPSRGRAGELRIFAPDGTEGKAQNGSVGRYRTTFDVHLPDPGTYKVAVLSQGLFASYSEGGATKRWSGTPEAFAKEVPPDAEKLRVTKMQNRMEVFVTAGKPSDTVLKPTGVGLELAPITHPNDLFAGEAARFRLLLDGQPAAELSVTVIPGGIRYRDRLEDVQVTTAKDGSFTITWREPGMYWLNAVVRDNNSGIEKAERRASYTATFEVLAP